MVESFALKSLPDSEAFSFVRDFKGFVKHALASRGSQLYSDRCKTNSPAAVTSDRTIQSEYIYTINRT